MFHCHEIQPASGRINSLVLEVGVKVCNPKNFTAKRLGYVIAKDITKSTVLLKEQYPFDNSLLRSLTVDCS
jgi:hypothetical protein